jgi:tetratricopeptide (TPR) repeat protein
VVDAGSAPEAPAPMPAAVAPAPPPEPSRAPPAPTYEALLERADALHARGKAEAALELYGRAHELRPDGVEPLTGRGLCLLDLESAPAAEDAFEDALALDERHGPAIMGLAEALRAQGRVARALEYYQKYLGLFPDGPAAATARTNLQRLKR